MSISHDSKSPSRRWTPERTRAATPFPKPQGAIAKAQDYDVGRLLIGPIDTTERAMLRQIAETADLIDAGMQNGYGLPRFWLLVPAPAELIDFLATFEAGNADLEPDSDREEDLEGDDNEDREPDDDGGDVGAVCTEERRARYRERMNLAADACGFRPLRVLRRGDGDAR